MNKMINLLVWDIVSSIWDIVRSTKLHCQDGRFRTFECPNVAYSMLQSENTKAEGSWAFNQTLNSVRSDCKQAVRGEQECLKRYN